MSDDAVIAIERLSVRYGKKIACADVSLRVARGAVYALLGRNGAGKSSLVRCLLGHQKPNSGRAALFGEDVWKRRARLMTRVGVTAEEPDAPPAMTAKQLSAFCRRLYRSWDQKAVDQRLARFGVPTNVAFGRLSKGQKGEVMLALALGHHPELLVLDDPTLGLDVVARKALYDELVGELADRGTTVFLTTHDLSGFEGIATHVGIMKEGRIVLDEEL
ncbi:MAG TPA: ABC transporter ATP-binding protein, partial [Thermoanaerobaculia bacterium]